MGAQLVVMDQEKKHLRDMKLIVVVGPSSDPPPWIEVSDAYITVIGLWTGVDSGRLTHEWTDRYWEPFKRLDHKHLTTFDVWLPLSVATRVLAFDYKNNNDRYAVQAFHSDHWWSDDFIEMMADEIDERMALMPEVYPSFQFLPLGANSQWA